MELKQFLSQHGVAICLLNETHFKTDRALTFEHYVCKRTDRSIRGGGIAILVRRGTDHFAAPVSGLQNLENTSTHLIFSTRTVTLVAAYVPPIRPLIDSDLTESLSEGLHVLMVGYLNAKHMDWNFRLNTARGSLLRVYPNRNSCLIYGPYSPTTAYYAQYATLDVLDIVVVKDFVLSERLIVYIALSSDHLPILIDTTSRLSFQNLQDRPDYARKDRAALQVCLEDRILGNPVGNDEEAIDNCVEELTGGIQEPTAAYALKRGKCRPGLSFTP
jgi:hypothetical protein